MTEDEFKIHLKWVTDNGIEPISHYCGKYKHIMCRCAECGNEWKTTPSHLLDRRQGCANCKRRKVWESRKDRTTRDSIVRRINEVFPQYNLSAVSDSITTQKDKVSVICPKHGLFTATIDSLLHRHECPKCSYEKRGDAKALDRDAFIAKSAIVHGGKYDYSKVPNKIRSNMKVPIICDVHGMFFQTPYHHLNRRQGCPLCSESFLEKEIKNFLDENNIEYEQQKRLQWLGLQSLDFYIQSLNLAVECQGVQHYVPIEFFGGTDAFTKQVERDANKSTLCKNNGISLVYYTNYGDKSKYIGKTFNDLTKLFKYINTIKNESFVNGHLKEHSK